MEAITIFNLNAMYDSVHHKLAGVILNSVYISWPQWLDQSTQYETDHVITYFLDPLSKAIHIQFPELNVNIIG